MRKRKQKKIIWYVQGMPSMWHSWKWTQIVWLQRLILTTALHPLHKLHRFRFCSIIFNVPCFRRQCFYKIFFRNFIQLKSGILGTLWSTHQFSSNGIQLHRMTGGWLWGRGRAATLLRYRICTSLARLIGPGVHTWSQGTNPEAEPISVILCLWIWELGNGAIESGWSWKVLWARAGELFTVCVCTEAREPGQQGSTSL